MINFDKIDIQRITVSAIGALTLSAASIFSAVGPVKAATMHAPVTADAWQTIVERQLDNGAANSVSHKSDRKVHMVKLALEFTADGDFARAAVARSSGNKMIDASALDVARHVAYPVLPAAMRGQPQTIAMNLYYGRSFDAVDQATRTHRMRVRQFARGNGTQLAAR